MFKSTHISARAHFSVLLPALRCAPLDFSLLCVPSPVSFPCYCLVLSSGLRPHTVYDHRKGEPSYCSIPQASEDGSSELHGVVKDGVQWSEGDSWPIGEWAECAGTVGGVEREH